MKNESIYPELCRYFEFRLEPFTFRHPAFEELRNFYFTHYLIDVVHMPFIYNIVDSFTDEVIYKELFDDEAECVSNQDLWIQLPSLRLYDVAILFTLMHQENRPGNNPFVVPENYPSPFAEAFLKDTYGYVLFDWQLTGLLTACLPFEDNNNRTRYDILRLFRHRDKETLRYFRTLQLPDGYNLFELLKHYTLLQNNWEVFPGYVCPINFTAPYKFINAARKYMDEKYF